MGEQEIYIVEEGFLEAADNLIEEMEEFKRGIIDGKYSTVTCQGNIPNIPRNNSQNYDDGGLN